MQYRINKFLARAGLGSRRAVEKFITEGRISINGETITDFATQVVPGSDKVEFDGEKVRLSEPVIYSFNKPKGVLTTLSDPQGRKTIADFTNSMEDGLFPVGRLDIDVSGLILLTTDGDFAHKLLHPSFEVKRKYVALVEPTPTASLIKNLLKGIKLEDGFAQAKSAALLSASPVHSIFRTTGTLIELEVSEGRNHFIKRFLSALGHPVKKLIRTEFGPYKLSGLKSGQFRPEEFR